MKTSHSVMLCFALWVGGTSLLINEYIHVGKEKDEALLLLENEVLRLKITYLR